MPAGRFVAYFPVSTDKQGRAGPGLEKQQKIVSDYLDDGNGELLEAFTELERGKDYTRRPQLQKAIHACRTHGATLIIPQLDRLSRDAAFLLGLQKDGYAFVCASNPEVDSSVLSTRAFIAEQEQKAKSARIKAALAAAKARGVRLGGNPGNLKRQDVGRARANAVQAARADARAAQLAPVIAEIRANGRCGLRKIARALNERGITAPRGGTWSSQQVKCLLARMPMASEPASAA
jgi:DNA invertase Pin-like site-specific DNA recombinase